MRGWEDLGSQVNDHPRLFLWWCFASRWNPGILELATWPRQTILTSKNRPFFSLKVIANFANVTLRSSTLPSPVLSPSTLFSAPSRKGVQWLSGLQDDQLHLKLQGPSRWPTTTRSKICLDKPCQPWRSGTRSHSHGHTYVRERSAM